MFRSASSAPKTKRSRHLVGAGIVAAAIACYALVAGASAATATANGSKSGFGFNATGIAGFPTGEVRLTGGGAFDSVTGFVHSAGGFRCTAEVDQGPLAGCETGQGVRWDTANLLRGTSFKCTGAATETLKPVSTGAGIAVLSADFYRAGDGNDESFTANMIVAANDIAPDIPGVRTSGSRASAARTA